MPGPVPIAPEARCSALTRTPWVLCGADGADQSRTGDPLLAKQVLSQLSYSPGCIRLPES